MTILKFFYRVILLPALFCLSACSNSSRIENDFFDFKSLNGWWAAEAKYWSVEDSAIVGRTSSETSQNDFLWSDVKVSNFYLDVEVKHDSSDRNAGIQFRSQKANDYGQAVGYQADIGVNLGDKIWGTLYHEHGRGLLNGSDLGKNIVKDGEWNRYEILAVGHKIWIAVNGQIISATEDPGGELEGFISLQIHSGPPQTVRYRIRKLIHDPEVLLAGKKENELNALLRQSLVPAAGHTLFSPGKEEVILLVGGTNISNMQDDGYLETLITSAFPSTKFTFRNVAWDGDVVEKQFRDVGFSNFKANIDSLQPTKIFIQFGQMESLKGKSELESFIGKYREMLASLKKDNRQIFVLSPVPFDPAVLKVNGDPHWNNPLDISAIEQYVNAIRTMAQEQGHVFIDVYSYLHRPERKKLTNGIHLSAEGQLLAAEGIMESLGMKSKYDASLEPLRIQINHKNRIWFDYWRPGNWAFFKGDRQDPVFSRDWKNYSRRIFDEEIARFAPLLQNAEKSIREMQEVIKNKKPIEGYAETRTEAPNENSGNLLTPVEQEIAAFDVDPDYKIELFASEALGIAEPCAMRWDEKGRLWVLCIPAYPQPLPGSPANDRLVVLEDTNHDGRADQSTVFADNLNIPLGFELGHNGVYLGEQTRVVFLQDTNNDLKSDVRKTLFSGFGTHDSHQTINSFTWSPGGELFFSQGLSIHSYIETPWGVKKGHRGAIWRYRPAAGQLDNILDQNIASENPWGMTFGDYGELFSKSNNMEVYYTSPSLALSEYRNFIPEIGATIIKSGIVEIPRSGHLPEDMRNDILIAGYYNSKVERIKIWNDGAGYSGKLLKPLMSSRSNTFRPVDIKTGPDGAIYVLDWYNPIIGHYQASLRDPKRDKIHGRVWRITAKNRPLSKIVDISRLSISQMVAQLASDEYWIRYQVRRTLASKTREEVLPHVQEWVKTLKQANKNYDRNILEAAAVYETFEVINTELLERLRTAATPGARAYAAQLTGRWADRLTDPVSILKKLIRDPHPRVRMMAVVGLANVQLPESMVVVSELSEKPMDKFTLHAYNKTVFALKDVWEKAFRGDSIQFANNRQLASVISILKPEWYTAGMYRKLIGSGNYSNEVKTGLFSALAVKGEMSDIQYILQSGFARNNAKVIENLALRVVADVPDAVGNLIVRNLQSSETELQKLYIRMIGSWQLKQQLPALHRFTLAKSLSPEVLAEGLRVLSDLQYPKLNEALASVCDPRQPASVRQACIAGFVKTDMTRAAEETVREIKRPAKQNDLKQILLIITKQTSGADALAREIQKQRLDRNQAMSALSILTQNNINHPNLLATIGKYAPETDGSVPKDYNDTFAIKLAAMVASVGDIEKGKRIYGERLACASCHKIGSNGGDEGPNLSAIGSGLSVMDIITEVLWPNKNIKEGFLTVKIQMKNGEVFQGIKALETEKLISIKATAGSPPREFRKADVQEIVETGSSMPWGLVNTITQDERAHLIKYLSSQKN